MILAKKIRLGGRMNLSRRLMLWFGLLVLVPMLVSTMVIQEISNRILRAKMLHQITTVAKARADALENYAYERSQAASVIGRNPQLARVVQTLQNPESSPREKAEAEDKVRSLVNYVAPSLGFTEAILIGPGGKVLFRSPSSVPLGDNVLSGPQRDTPLAALIRRSLTLLDTDISDFALYPGFEMPLVFMVAPIIREDGRADGLIVLQMNTPDIYDIVQDYTGLGKTGDIKLGSHQGDTIQLVAPTRTHPDAAFKLSIEFGQNVYGVGMQRAVLGNQGAGEIINMFKQPALASWVYIPSFRLGLTVGQDVEEAMALVDQQREAMLGVLFAILTLALVIALTVSRSISLPIQMAVDAAERVAEGDLSVNLSTDRQDETGKLVNALGRMVSGLNSLIGQVQRSTIELVSTANSLGAMTKTQSDEVNNLGATTSEIAAATKQISATSEELLSTMSGITRVADHTSGLANQGQSSLGDMEGAIRALAEASHSISARLSLIHEKANAINSVTTTIARIADQTNLLSLNASIEAEKAGEYGLGFAVLAREIRALADQTAVATLDIEQMVKEMQDSVTGGVMEMDKFAEQVDQSVDETHAISLRFGEIIQQVQALMPQFEAVHEGMSSQSAGAKQIRDSMVSLTESIRISMQALEQTTHATHRLEGAIGELRNEIAAFKLI